jgi:hypothetical protein
MVKSDGRHWFRCGGRRHSDANLDKPIAGASARNVVCPPGLPCVAFLSAAVVSAGKRRGVIRGGFPSQPPTRKEKKKKHNKKERGRAPADNSSQTGQNQVSQEGGGWLKKNYRVVGTTAFFPLLDFPNPQRNSNRLELSSPRRPSSS